VSASLRRWLAARAAGRWRLGLVLRCLRWVKWSQRQRTTGSVAPGKMGGHRKPVLAPHRAFIIKRVGQTPHLTLHALKDELAARGVKVSHNAVWLFLRREGLRFKKNTVRP
jgi:transposase